MKVGILQMGAFNLIIYALVIYGLIKLAKYLIRYNADYKQQLEHKDKEQSD